ncbi:MAG: type II secretion system minor pseudopilin GspI [Gammaproteobacteria bacterium]|nr:type II secretion system minor pseudopilin GspI [Gammaproteobacteria bacterium]
MKAKGFTLVEVLIALVIVAVSLSALVTANQQNTNSITYFQQKTLANLVISNLSVDKRIGLKPNMGYQSGEYEMGKQIWYWQTNTQTTPNKGIIKTDLSLYPSIEKRDNKQSAATLVLYLEK